MEPKQEGEKKLSRAELEKITAEFAALIGNKLRNYRDGDAERLLFKNPRKKGSNADS
jgi:hypothetical protein